MSTPDTCCSILPYFKVAPGKLDEFKALASSFVEKTRSEPKCLYYAFTFNGNEAHCREGYEGAAGVLAHVENVGPLIGEALKISELTCFEIHGSAADIEQLREPLKGLNPTYFVLHDGFRR